jgi:transcriptional regulator with GAF, ATPase, and Fis domain
MAQLGVSKKKKSPRVTELSRLKKELKRVTDQLESRDRELAEAFERQTATDNILRVIASSLTDLQPVLDSIAQSAARVCGSDDATIRLIEDDTLSLVAHYGTIRTGPARIPMASRTPGREALLGRTTVHIPDMKAEPERFQDSRAVVSQGVRTFLVTPLLREDLPIGLIAIRRMEVKPFSDKEITQLETFADQAVIAIEMHDCSKNSKRHWSSKLRQAKFWVSSPAHRLIFSRCWIQSQKVPRGYAMLRML